MSDFFTCVSTPSYFGTVIPSEKMFSALRTISGNSNCSRIAIDVFGKVRKRNPLVAKGKYSIFVILEIPVDDMVWVFESCLRID